MKKFMKAIAFVTVMCMALSTVAFAADAVGSATKVDDKSLTVTVTEAAANEQIALYIVAESATASTADTPLFIDQKGADANGDATFTAKFDGTVEAVHVFVGYGKFATANNRAADLGAVTLKEATTAITVTKAEAGKVLKNEDAEADFGSAFAFEFAITTPDGVSAQKMVWAITYATDENGGTETVYSDAVDVSGYSFGALVGGSVKLGVAFSNGSRVRDIPYVDIVDVDAIFLFNDTAGTVKSTGNIDFSGDYRPAN